MNSRWFWLPVLGCNAYLIATGLAWYRYGWKWALAVFVGGPGAMVLLGTLTLVAVFLFGIHEPLCIECGQLAVLQIRRKRYLRPLCEPCARRLAGLQPIAAYHKAEEWRL